jgi:predicted anti-sigma-YlaC factor YlaD
MNCELCKKELDAYLEGKLPEGIRIQVKTHLENCKNCTETYNLMNLADKVMEEEKGIQSNPFLTTRIMANIEELEQKRESFRHIPVYQMKVKPALIALSIAAAVFFGVLTGNIYKPATPTNKVPVELSYINDASLESIEMLGNE